MFQNEVNQLDKNTINQLDENEGFEERNEIINYINNKKYLIG